MAKLGVSDVQEDYLEAILFIQSERSVARLTEIAHRLRLSKSTVSTTLKLLRKRGLVIYEPYRHIELTKAGARIARQVARRHLALRKFLIEVLLLDEKLADETACKMEHGISRQVIERFIKFTEFVQRCPYSVKEWLGGFGFHCREGACEHCESAIQAGCSLKAESQRDRGRET
jgi:DtxR family Mn-dependent transcriptional regulator